MYFQIVPIFMSGGGLGLTSNFMFNFEEQAKKIGIEFVIFLLAKSTHTFLANSTTSKRLVIGTTILTLWAWVILTGQFSRWKIWWIISTKRTRALHFIEYHCIQQVYCGRLRHWSSGLSFEKTIPN